MHHPLRDRRSRGLIELILVPMFFAVSPASAAIFKCVAKDGIALYQNFPCQFDSTGWMPSNPQPAKVTLMPGDAIQGKAKAARVNVSSTINATNGSEPRIGMTSDEVTALLGEPEERVEDEPARGGRISIWRYADGRFVKFDHEHHVLGIQR